MKVDERQFDKMSSCWLKKSGQFQQSYFPRSEALKQIQYIGLETSWSLQRSSLTNDSIALIGKHAQNWHALMHMTSYDC